MGDWINVVRVDLHFEFSFFSFQRLPLVYFNFKLPQHYLKSWIIFQRVLPQCSSSATALDLIFECILQTGSSFLLILLLQHQKISVTWRLAWVSQVSHGKVSICQYRRHQRCRFSSKIGKIFWKTKWQHATVFLAGESHGKRSLAGYSLEVEKSRTPLGWLSMHAALVMNIGDSLFPAQPLSYIPCPWVLGTELSVWPSFFSQWWRISNCLASRWFFCTSPRWENIFFCPSTDHCQFSPICHLWLMVFISFPIGSETYDY